MVTIGRTWLAVCAMALTLCLSPLPAYAADSSAGTEVTIVRGYEEKPQKPTHQEDLAQMGDTMIIPIILLATTGAIAVVFGIATATRTHGDDADV